ncbi:MAG: HEAT repeat domain-containing protein [Planctomycetota bacterium]
MRSFLVCLLVCFPAVSAFAGPADIRKLGDEGTLQAAQELVRIWDGHGRAIAALRAEWSELQRKRDETRIKLRNQRDPRKEAPLRARLKKIDAKIPEVDGKLATLELERAAVLDGLARIKDAEALGWLAAEALRKMRDPALRQAAAMAIARSKRVGPDALLAALGASKKPEMVVPLLQALGRHGASAQAVPALTDYLKHRDWSVRVAAAFALAATASPQGVEPVVAAMERTKKDTRERRELAAALTRYTGQKHGPYPDAWRSWWNANRKAA